jgi:predicted aldo/keto reductase-like oxidoreductase
MTTLGRSELRITRIGCGGIPIQRLSEDQAILVVRKSLDCGLNWLDTAHTYGSSEEVMGKAIKGYDRNQLHLFTKSQGREPESLRTQIDLSLKRLGTDYLDLFQFHNVPSVAVWQDMLRNGSMDLVRSYRDRGIIRTIGVSAHFEQIALLMIEHPEVEVLQYPFNFIVEEEGKRVLRACERKNIGFIAMKPFGGGLLEDAPPCIRFLLQFPGVVTDPGFDRIDQVQEVVDLYIENAPLSVEDRQTIDRLRNELGKKFCRRCGYCLPCDQGVEIITLMTMESFIKRLSLNRLHTFPARAAESAEMCIECGKCEQRCPYQLPIIDQIKKSAAALRKVLRRAS